MYAALGLLLTWLKIFILKAKIKTSLTNEMNKHSFDWGYVLNLTDDAIKCWNEFFRVKK